MVCGSSWGENQLLLKLVSGKGIDINRGIKETYRRIEQA